MNTDKFILLTRKSLHESHKILICVNDIKAALVVQNNGGGHFCSEILLRNVCGKLRVIETPEEIMDQIRQSMQPA